MNAPEILDFKPVVKNTLRGFATVKLPSGMIFAEVSVHISNGRPWASPPSRPMIDRDGRAMRDESGKVRYQPVISFANKETRNRWSDAVIAALRAARPDAIEADQ